METFYTVNSIRIKAEDGSFVTTTQNQEADSTVSPKDWAYQKFFSILGTNWNDSTYSYLGVYIIRSDGVVIESKVRDSRSE